MNFAIVNDGNSMLEQAGVKKKNLYEYQKFVKREFKKCQEDYPSKKAPEIMKMIGKKWRESKK